MQVKGAILNRGEDGYSYFKQVFDKIEVLSIQYNWLISYPECYPQDKELEKRMQKDYLWLPGREIKSLFQLEDFQWVWGVLSGFSSNILLEDVLKYPLPYADGYSGFWKNPVTLQHPLAEIELVAWDSSCTLCIAKKERIIDEFWALYIQAEDLEEYNKK